MIKLKDNVSLILLLTLLVGTLSQLKYPTLKPGQVFKLTVARNNQQVGDITYTIGSQPLINDVTITFDHNQSNNLLPNQTHMVGIGMPNDGVNDGDNFTGTIKVDVPDGFVFDSSRSNGVVTGSNVGDDLLGMFNTLGSMEGISISQEAAGKPIIIEYNRTKSELGKGFVLLYGHYIKNISGSQNTFTATVTATTTNADGDKANYDGSIQTIIKSHNIGMPVENPARNSLDSSFAIGENNIYRDQVNPDGSHQVVPSQPVTKSKKLPQTGEEHNSLATIGLLILSLATGLGLKKRKKD